MNHDHLIIGRKTDNEIIIERPHHIGGRDNTMTTSQ